MYTVSCFWVRNVHENWEKFTDTLAQINVWGQQMLIVSYFTHELLTFLDFGVHCVGHKKPLLWMRLTLDKLNLLI